jgi:hypothetical protein
MTIELRNSDGDQPLSKDEKAGCMFVFGKQ